MLTLERLTRRFGTSTVLDGIDLEIAEGAVTCLVGPSGCGKSTILRLVAGLDRPDDGRILLRGEPISAPGWALAPERRRLNMVFQDYALWPHMTVRAIVGYGLARLPAKARAARVDALLAAMRIDALADRLPSQISGGQQQRVAIARALATDPDVLLLDEPLSNLDVQLRMTMRIELADLFRRLGRTVLYVTHDPLEAASFADLLVVMRAGAIEQAGAPQALFARPRSAWIATLAGYEARLPARVAEIRGSDLALDVGAQTIVVPHAAAAGAVAAGDDVTLMLHPARTRLLPVDAPVAAGEARLAGRVVHALYEGRDWRVVVAVEGESVSTNAPAPVPADASVVLAFTPDAAIVFPS
ncbi:ABC transporter ATP-binding protein [Salinarimonas chemoclinalis]|uniref:ABC transporter ATP-binding protein n=1 Tax=Salinarimonas chemoclinalis TaxID=3241599 RepID=UPI003557F557